MSSIHKGLIDFYHKDHRSQELSLYAYVLDAMASQFYGRKLSNYSTRVDHF